MEGAAAATEQYALLHEFVEQQPPGFNSAQTSEDYMGNPFGKIGHFFAAILHFVISDRGRAVIANYLDEAQKLLQPALDAVSAIAEASGSRSFEEIAVLAEHYALGVVTPEMITNDATLSGLLKHAAMAELARATGTTMPMAVLDLAVQSAYVVFKQAKAEMKTPDVVGGITGTVVGAPLTDEELSGSHDHALGLDGEPIHVLGAPVVGGTAHVAAMREPLT